MASISSQNSPADLLGWLQKIFRWVDTVHPSITGEDRVRSALLARMLLISSLVGIFLVSMILVNFPEQIYVLDTQFVLFAVLLIPVYFILNRIGQFRAAYTLFILTTLIAFSVPVYGQGTSASSLAFSAIPFFIASVFFVRRTFVITIIAACLWIGLNIVANADNPESAVNPVLINYVTIWFFLIMMSILVTTFVSHLRSLEANRRRELEVANEQLRESEHLLEQRVEARTRELQAARHDAEQAREQAETADRLKSQFLASMSHELRTPLNSILNYGEFIHMGLLGEVNEEQKNAVQSITESGRHLLALINDVLDISKIQSGMLRLMIEDNIDLTRELDVAIETARTLVGGKPVVVKSEIAPNLPVMSGDRRRIRQILLNLASNAAKFTEEGEVVIKAESRGDILLFTVRDTGPGVKEAEQDRLFKPFEQTETGVKHTGGTGLGLAISKALVDAHHGKIWFESIVGTGTTFFVELPVKAVISEATSAKA